MYRLAIHPFPERGAFVVGHRVEEGFAECGVRVRPLRTIVVPRWVAIVRLTGTSVIAALTFGFLGSAVVFRGRG